MMIQTKVKHDMISITQQPGLILQSNLKPFNNFSIIVHFLLKYIKKNKDKSYP